MLYPNIAAELARNGMTQEDFAKRLHVCRKTVYNWMVKGNVPMKKLETMAELFNVSTDYLLGRSPKA